MNDERQLFETGLERQSARERLTQTLGEETIKALHQRSDMHGWFGIIACWVAIAALLAIAEIAISAWTWWSIPVLLTAMLFIGGRILGLAILSHEGAHRTLFATQSINDPVTNWLCSAPVFLDLIKYRRHHAQHHVHTGTEKDVDLPLTEGFPTTRISLLRKFLRDLTGQTGLKSLIGFSMMNAELIEWNVTGVVKNIPRNGRSNMAYLVSFLQNSRRTLIFHTLFFAFLFSVNLAELFLVWWAAYLFTYPICIRIRSMAEHAMTERTSDMLKNTRTTKAGWITRALFAPCHVNLHIEHHALVSVPYWQLPKLHKLMRDKQITPEPPTYWDVLRLASSAK